MQASVEQHGGGIAAVCESNRDLFIKAMALENGEILIIARKTPRT
jgi:hypothetical protein